MLNPDDITFVLSGGITNNDPAKSLGGLPSSTGIITGSNDNLFDDLTDAELLNGLTDYRCFFVFNDNPIESLLSTTISIARQIDGGATAFIGVNQATDIQHVTIRDTTAAPAFMVLSYEGHHFTVPKQITPIAWAASFQQAINSFGVLSGVTVGPIVSGLQLTFNIHFQGADNFRNHQLLEQVTIDNNVSIVKIVEGAPINFIPDPLLYNTTSPFNIHFTNSTSILIGTLRPGDGFPIWAQRITPSNTEEQDLDGFRLKITGTGSISTAELIVAQAVLFPRSYLTANGGVLSHNNIALLTPTANMIINSTVKYSAVAKLKTTSNLVLNAIVSHLAQTTLIGNATLSATIGNLARALLPTDAFINANSATIKNSTVLLPGVSSTLSKAFVQHRATAILSGTASMKFQLFLLHQFSSNQTIWSIEVHPTLDRVYLGVTDNISGIRSIITTKKEGTVLSSTTDSGTAAIIDMRYEPIASVLFFTDQSKLYKLSVNGSGDLAALNTATVLESTNTPQSITFDGSKVWFCGTDSNLYSINYNGTGLTSVAPFNNGARTFFRSPNQIWTSATSTTPPFVFDNINDSTLVQSSLTLPSNPDLYCPATGFDYSPTDDFIYYVRKNVGVLTTKYAFYKIPATGGAETLVYDNISQDSIYTDPVIASEFNVFYFTLTTASGQVLFQLQLS